MAIAANSAIIFYGTQDDLDSTSGAVTDGSFSVAGDLVQWTNDDDAPMASFTLFADWDTTGPDPNSVINLYARAIDTFSTNPGEIPDANHRHIYIGNFPMNDVLTNQYILMPPVALPNWETDGTGSVYEFYIENQTGATLKAGWIIYVTPITIGPHA